MKQTSGSASNDAVKCLPSKRGLQDFLIFPKGKKITVESCQEEISEPGSHKKYKTDEQQSCKYEDNHQSQKREDLTSMEPLSTLDSENKISSSKDLL